ncbi:neutral zinc metallopeptidase [Pseudanabaena sp. PCC 6802]|uniref:KPN_02809 family neutral zinc metallopeptidase n=1 Tax=Pseudanabaena sp. PCC 6802 TaxID=118173 RepID=UPI000349B415|nr:neutral zinc metallopeptidase [Pseudanabaena sp. PCC 6802]
MKWDEMRQSDNVEDERGSSGQAPRQAIGKVGLGTIAIAVLAGLIFRVNPLEILGLVSGNSTAPVQQTQTKPINDRDSAFVRSILGDTEDTWNRIFQQQLKARYQPPKLVLFRNAVNSACGSAQTESGPFYCPADQKVYLDMAFFEHLQATATGNDADFAKAYAIAHEVGHHIQTILGTSGQVRQLQSTSSKAKANELSVRVELQADCYAGVWGHFTAQRGLIGDRDIAKALDTATQIGDDYLQKQAQGHVVPESFTHGTSQQRVTWFRRGLESGDIKQCDTFSVNRL